MTGVPIGLAAPSTSDRLKANHTTAPEFSKETDGAFSVAEVFILWIKSSNPKMFGVTSWIMTSFGCAG
jgi:hypothetical protein